MSRVAEEYSHKTFRPVDPVLHEVLERADRLNMPHIHVGYMDGLHLEVMMRMGGYKKVVEVGTLAGFSGICIARGLGEGGMLHTIDSNPDYAAAARESFEKAGLSKNVKVHVGVALEVLENLRSEGPFDAIFIDADKFNYPNYLNWAEENIRVGGAVFGDNTFGWGHVLKDKFDDPHMEKQINGIKQFNQRLATSPKFRATILPTQQGLTVAVKIA